MPENNVDVDGVEMRFKAFRDVNSPDIDTIFVGDEFFMYIKYLGSMSYTIFNYEIGSKEINFYKYFLILICTMNLNLSKQNYHFIMVKLFFFIFPFILINQMLPKIFSMMETLGFSHFIQFCIVLRTFLWDVVVRLKYFSICLSQLVVYSQTTLNIGIWFAHTNIHCTHEFNFCSFHECFFSINMVMQ